MAKVIDATITVEEMNEYGYLWDGMVPLNKDMALTLFNNDYEVYRLYEDNSEGTVAEIEEFDTHKGIFGIEKEDASLFLKQQGEAV